MLTSLRRRDADLKRLYNRAAETWQATVDRLGYGAAYASIFQACPPPSDPVRVIDIGCGTGAFAAAFLQSGGAAATLTLLDPCAAMLDQACAHLSTAKDVPTISTLPHPLGDGLAGGYDIALAGHVIEHTDTPTHTLAQINALLVPGGRIYLSVSKPHWCTALLWWRWRHRAYTAPRICAMLRDANFTDVRVIRYQNGPPSRLSVGYSATRP